MERNATRPDPDRMARLIGFADRGILLADDMFTIVEANPHALAVYGYGHDEIVGMPIGALFGDETGYREAIEGTDHRRGSVFHACHRRKDGRLFPVEISLNNLELDGRIYRQAVIRDLAERAHAEDALRRMNRTLIALAQCNEVLAYGESEEEILTEICRIVVDAGYRFAWAGYAEADEERSVRPVAQYGYEDGYLDHIQLSWADNERGHGPTGTAIRAARPSCIRNIADHENFRPWRDDALQRGYASCLAIPITLDGTVIGALTVHAARVDAFDEDEIRLLEELAGKLSWGISIQRHRAERERTAAQLRSSEERYRNLFARAKVAQILINPEDGVIVDANEAAVAYYGYSADELRGQSIGLINIADAPDIQTDLGRACHGQRHQFHFQHRLASGEIREVEVYSGPVEIGGQILLYSIVHDITDRVRIAEALRDSEERYHTLVRTAPTGIYRTDAAGCPVYVSRRWCELAGIPPEESADDGWLRAVHPEDRARVTDLWHRCLAARTDFEAEYRMGRADGPSTWVSCSAKPEIDAAGSFSGYIGAVQDISRIKKLEDQLRQALLDEQEASQQLQEAMASLSNAQRIAAFGNWDWDLETGNTWWSDGVYRLSGMQRREPAPTVDGLMQVIHPADRFRVWESFQDSLTNGAPLDIDYRVIWPDGTVRVLHSVGEATSDAGGRPVRMSGVIQDVTAQRTAEAEIGKLSTVVAQTPLSVLITDTSGRIEYVNPFFEQISGYRLAEVRGRTPRILRSGCHGPEVYRDLWNTVLDGGTWRGELLNQTKDGRQLWHAVTIAALRDPLGNIVNFVGIEEDITERKRSEERLAKAIEDLHRSNRDLEQFAYVVSHDLREPLRTITNFISLLERRIGGGLDDTGREFLDFVKTGAKRMDRMIVALLEYSRVGRKGAPMIPAPIGPSVGRAINNLDAAISEIGAIVTMAGDMPIVRIDDNEITRLFQNLIGNAIKYRAPGATPEIRVSMHRDGDHWVFDVTDNGIGIDPKHFERIFGVFQRLHTQDQYEGTGIGLAVCRRIVERHGGRIWVDSAPARGSIFHVALPAIDAENEAADAPPPVSPA